MIFLITKAISNQFAFSYRENITKTIGLGLKVSLLSGIAYSNGNITSSDISIDPINNRFIANARASFISTKVTDSTIIEASRPNFKYPGIAFTAGANFKFKKGWMVLANVKDLGFIQWNKSNTRTYRLNETITINNANDK